MTISSAMRNTGLAVALFASLTACNADGVPREATCNLGDDQSRLTGVVTSLAFNANVLSELGVTVEATATTQAVPQHPLALLPGPVHSFTAEAECMAIDVADGHLMDFTSGRITHTGGPVLVHDAATINLSGFELRVGVEPRTFDIFTAAGEHVLHATLPHYELDPSSGELDVFNVDLGITSDLAARWNAPQLAGLAVGTLSLHGKLVLPSASTIDSTTSGLAIGTQDVPLNACDDFSGNVDVALIGMDAVQQRARVGDKVVIAPSARLKNVGTANVPWQAKFSGTFPPYNTDQHPFLVWALYREVGGVFEMLAHSDVKHAFLTINSNCNPGSCTVSSVLGLGCEDVYGVSTNDAHLGPRSEINAKTGVWAHCNVPAPNTPSHFDQAAPFCQQDNNGGTEPSLQHRVVASDAELSVANANYYFASWYVVRDDINIFNNMGWRRIIPSLSGGTWSFNLATTYRQGSAVDAWVDPAMQTANRLNVTHKDPAAGSVQLAATATDLGNGKFLYVYALHNHDYNPNLSSLIIPMASDVVLEQAKFSDGDEDGTNDWIRFTGIGQTAWTAPTAASRLSWGIMVTVSFVANVPPSRGVVRLTRSDGGSVNIKSLVAGNVE